MLNTSKYITVISFSRLFNWSVLYLNETKLVFNTKYSLASIGKVLKRNKTTINIQDNTIYKQVTIKIRNGGVMLRDKKKGRDIGTKRQYLVSEGQFILSKIDARNGAMGIIPSELNGAIVTQDFLSYDIDKFRINPQYLVLVTTTQGFIAFCQTCSSGTTNRQRIEELKFLDIKIPLPHLDEQHKLVESYNQNIQKAEAKMAKADALEQQIEMYLFDSLGILADQSECIPQHQMLLQFIDFKMINEWGLNKIINNSNHKSTKYITVNLEKDTKYLINVFRGKSPKYASSGCTILNQKCVRWNKIEIDWAKSVDENWLRKIDKQFLTRRNDILINSTGEGTIGRSSLVLDEHSGLLYDSHVLLLRLNIQYINPLFYVLVLNSSYGQKQINNVKSAQSTKQTELGISNLRKIQIPLPSLEIQNEIVAHITKLQDQIEHLRTEAVMLREASINRFNEHIFNNIGL